MLSQADREVERAVEQMRIGDHLNAVTTLRHALTTDPEHAPAHALLSLCLVNQKRIHASKYEAEIALALEPDLEMAHFAMAHAYLAHGKLKAAEEHCRYVMASDPSEPSNFWLQADIAEMRGAKPATLIRILEEALSHDPDNPVTLARMSKARAREGDLGKARFYAEEALKIQADHPKALVALGHVLLQEGRTSDAREHALWALKTDAGDTGALFLLSAVKSRANILTGIWWRMNTWMLKVGQTRAIVTLLLAFILQRLVFITAAENGQETLADGVRTIWLALVLCSIAGPTMFRRSLEKELEDVQLREDY